MNWLRWVCRPFGTKIVVAISVPWARAGASHCCGLTNKNCVGLRPYFCVVDEFLCSLSADGVEPIQFAHQGRSF